MNLKNEYVETLKMEYDELNITLANYVHQKPNFSQEAYKTAALALADALGCAILSLNYPECTKLLGPIVKDTLVPNGSRVIGTPYVLDPVMASFNLGLMIRWLDFNDTWLASEWGHPSDNLGGILAVMDQEEKFLVKDLLEAMIKAYEIQGVLALNNSLNQVGLDHVLFVKVATTAVVSKLLNGSYQNTLSALSNAWIDLGPLRAYRHYPNTGSRKSWAAGDATSRGVFFALLSLKGEMGYPTALSAKTWGFYDVIFDGKPISLSRPLKDYVMENILFKVAYPAEFHAQTAVEATIKLHHQLHGKIDDIEKIEIITHESAIRIIDKKGPLKNPADRDHCLQYMVAIALLFGNLTADDYLDDRAKNPQIDLLRNKIIVKESKEHSKNYHEENKRAIANTLIVHFKEGISLDPITVEYPLGHRKRRDEGTPLLFKKFESNLRSRFEGNKVEKIVSLFQDYEKLIHLPVNDLVELFTQPF